VEGLKPFTYNAHRSEWLPYGRGYGAPSGCGTEDGRGFGMGYGYGGGLDDASGGDCVSDVTYGMGCGHTTAIGSIHSTGSGFV
jgi:hypothetical protein